MANAETKAPVTPARLRAAYDVSPEQMRVVFRPRSWGTAGFLVLWQIGWTVGCVALAAMVINDPQIFTILFAIPFWTAWIFVFVLVIGAVTRRQELEVDSQGLLYIDQALIRLKNRRVPRDEFRGFEVAQRAFQRKDREEVPQIGLEIRTAGKPLFIFADLPEAELRWLAWQLSQLVGPLPGDETPAADAAEKRVTADTLGRLPEPLALADEPVEPPSDCSWELVPEFGALVFAQRGRWSWTAVLGMLFVCGFWNGIVSVFVCVLLGIAPGGPAGIEWWFLFFFLIPFEAIGLAILFALVLVLLEPARRTAWSFDADQVEHRVTWLGLGPRWTYPVGSLASVNLLRGTIRRTFGRGNIKMSANVQMAPPADPDSQFGLSLVQANNTELCEIRPLTEGEARWMADTLLRERPEWFHAV